MVIYSPLTVAAEGGGVGVGGSGVEVGMEGVGVFEIPNEAQAERLTVRNRIRIKLRIFFVDGNLKNIVEIIPTKNPHPLPLFLERG